MKRLNPTVHDLGETRVLSDFFGRDTTVDQKLPGAPGAINFHATGD
jgi:hypothetical protein